MKLSPEENARRQAKRRATLKRDKERQQQKAAERWILRRALMEQLQRDDLSADDRLACIMQLRELERCVY